MIALAAALPLVALGMTVLNLVTWPRGRPGGVASGRVSVLIPARNEERNIGACVRSVLASRHPVHEVLVYDDGSTDGTRAVLDGIADPRLRVLDGVPLPAGWVGKPHACHRLAEAATGDQLLFLDADVVLAPDGIERLAEVTGRWGAGLAFAVPRQLTGSPVEHLVLPLLHLTYTSWLWLPLIPLSSRASLLAANGQVVWVGREALARLGGFAAVRTDVVDDMALGRAAKRAGLRVLFVDGAEVASCRMYQSAAEVWRGFSKNVYEGLGSPLGLGVAIGLYLATFVAPFGLAAAALLEPAWAWPAAVGVGANLAQRLLLAVRYRHHPLSVLLHPVAVLGLVAIALNSWRWTRSGAVSWAGRTYPERAARAG